MKPSFFNRLDRLIFTGQSSPSPFERACDIGLAIVIGLSLAAIFWG